MDLSVTSPCRVIMAKLWLLILLVATFQLTSTHPVDENKVDEAARAKSEEYLTDQPQLKDDEEFKNLEEVNDEKHQFTLVEANVIDKFQQGVQSIGGKLKDIADKAKNFAKKGAKFLMQIGVTIDSWNCEGKTCQSCVKVSFPEFEFCLSFNLVKKTRGLYLIVSGKINGDEKISDQLKLDDEPRCFEINYLVGKICMKGLQGSVKTSNTTENIHYCLAIASEKLGAGCKLCASFVKEKIYIGNSPKVFPAVIENNDIFIYDKNSDSYSELTVDDDEFNENEEVND